METLDFIGKLAKTAILVSIAAFFVRCSFDLGGGGFMSPQVNIDGFEDGDKMEIIIEEDGDHKVVRIQKNGEDIEVSSDEE